MINAILFSLVLLSGYLLSGNQFLPQFLAIISAGLFALTALLCLLVYNRGKAKEYGIQALVFILAFAAIHYICMLDNRLASKGAVKIAEAYDAYKADHGKYPEKPAMLIHEYIKGFPEARHTIMWSSYRVVKNRVMFVVEPGLMAKAYDIPTRQWESASMEEMYPAQKPSGK